MLIMIKYLERAREARLSAMRVGDSDGIPGMGGCSPMIAAFVAVVGLTSYGAWNVLT